jgi:cyclopropane fatty-acyl-phospholipid synthase-like methyltransferase
MDSELAVSPFLPELLADMWALGCTPHLVVELLQPLKLKPGSTRVLDLGCGKGALGITLAKELGFRIHGVDLCEAFLQEATRRARELDVCDLCQFELRDLREAVAACGDFDLAALASLGGVLGTLDRCVSSMRQVVRPRGYMIIDDGFLSNTQSVDRPGYGHYRSHSHTLECLEAHGDTLLEERIYTTEQTRAVNLDYIHHISGRARELGQHHPEAAEALRAYVADQQSECEFIDREITRAIWLIQRA